MKHLKILIMGRPNVGKSTLVNRLVGSRKAIVADQPGVTRDISYFDIEHEGHMLTVVDSGGIFLGKSKDIFLQDEIESKVLNEIEAASRIWFIVDYKDGLHPHDEQIARVLRPQAERVTVLVNKVDNPEHHQDVASFFKLGFGEPVSISSAHGHGISDRLDDVVNLTAYSSPQLEKDEALASNVKVALVGRPNAGKSSLLNAILNEDRVIVSDVAGTTRDAISVNFKYHGKDFELIDTAGLRRHVRIKDDIEYYSTLRSSDAIKTADVTILVLDADEFLTDQDKRILRLVSDNAKSILVFVNKWDLTDRTDELRQQMVKKAKKLVPAFEYYPFVFGSAKVKHHIHKSFEFIEQLLEEATKRIKTSQINDFVSRVIERQPPPSKRGKRLKIFYATQAESAPPAFIFFVNDKSLLTQGYLRFLEKRLRGMFGFFGVPVKLFFKNRSKVKL